MTLSAPLFRTAPLRRIGLLQCGTADWSSPIFKDKLDDIAYSLFFLRTKVGFEKIFYIENQFLQSQVCILRKKVVLLQKISSQWYF